MTRRVMDSLSANERADLATAVWVLLIVFAVGLLIGLWVGKANACDSYEDCMKGNVRGWSQNGDGPKEPMYVQDEITSLRAIAYKLNEISEELDHTSRVTGCSEAMKNAGAC